MGFIPSVFVSEAAGPFGDSVIYRRPCSNIHVTNPRRKVSQASQHNKACKIFKHCDAIYKHMPDDERQIWRNAVKHPDKSGYDLWMSESMYLMNQGLYGPDNPSNSGGFTMTGAYPGTTYRPPEIVDVLPGQVCTGFSNFWIEEDPSGDAVVCYKHELEDPDTIGTFFVWLEIHGFQDEASGDYDINYNGWAPEFFLTKLHTGQPYKTYKRKPTFNRRIVYRNCREMCKWTRIGLRAVPIPPDPGDVEIFAKAGRLGAPENRPRMWNPDVTEFVTTIQWKMRTFRTHAPYVSFLFDLDIRTKNVKTKRFIHAPVTCRGFWDLIQRKYGFRAYWPRRRGFWQRYKYTTANPWNKYIDVVVQTSSSRVKVRAWEGKVYTIGSNLLH